MSGKDHVSEQPDLVAPNGTAKGLIDAVVRGGATALGYARSTARSVAARGPKDSALGGSDSSAADSCAADPGAADASGAAAPVVSVAAIEACRQFLFREARLLDERRFADWLELWGPDARYSMPTRSDVHRHSGEPFGDELTGPDGVWWFDDTAVELAARVTKLRTGKSWAEGPPSRTRRVVTNVEVDATSASSVRVRSNVLIYRGRRDHDVEWYSAARVDQIDCAQPSAAHLGDVGLGLLRERMVILDTNVIKADNLVMFL